jgi:hypothetical protein
MVLALKCCLRAEFWWPLRRRRIIFILNFPAARWILWLTRYERDQSVADFIDYMRQFVELLKMSTPPMRTRLLRV